MNAPKKKRNYLLIFASLLFLVGLPVATVTFSKLGLDKFKSMKADMRLLKDSTLLTQFDAVAIQGDTFSADALRGRLVILHLFDPANPDFTTLLRTQKQFGSKDERGKVLFFSMPLQPSNLDTAQLLAANTDPSWYLLPHNPNTIAQLKRTNPELLVIDPRGYLCDAYALNNEDEYRHMYATISLLMPKQKRKKYQYRPEADLYTQQ